MMILQGITIVLLAGFAQTPTGAQSSAPRYLSSDDSVPFSPAEFQRILAQLKLEREGLDADWSALTKRLNTRSPAHEPDLQRLQDQLKQALQRLQQERLKANTIAPNPFTPSPFVKPETPLPEPKKKETSQVDPPPPDLTKLPTEIDVVHLAQTLFRAERYEEALAAFRKVDLKGRRAEERAPIVFMTASCLHRLGKTDEAIALLRDVANARGDERFAGYAQWEIESLRWQREMQSQLQEIRQRRQAVEKR